MNFARNLVVLMLPLLFAGCGTIKEMRTDMRNKDISLEFDQSARGYIRMLRWHELDSAETTYVAPNLRDEYRKRIIAAGEVNIVDYRVKQMECSPEKREGSVRVEFDYFRPPSVKIHTLEDRQQWSYEGDAEHRVWRLLTLLPRFE